MKSDKDEAKKMVVYSLSIFEAYTLIGSLVNQMAAMEKGVSCGVSAFDCEGLQVIIGINCIE